VSTHPDDLHTDGNELAGLMSEIFAADVTSMPATCGHCGRTGALATYRVYHGAGLVARCPSCDAAALRVGVFDEALTLMWTGMVSVARAG
jgi:hypothetical protein